MSVNVLDVAEYILEKKKFIPAMKLQKLVYYCQAWSLVWEDRPMYKNKIEAWANGPVVVTLYHAHKGKYLLDSVGGDSSKLSSPDIESIDAVLKYYGNKSSQWLSDLTHQENPWKDARGDLRRGERGNEEITLASMAEYYGSL